jgi:protoporphyrinogen oxidase
VARIVIIGAGLTGLSAAYHLEKKGYHDYKLFEMNSTPGGLCRTVKQGGFSFDYTGHLLHINDDYFRTFLNTVIPPSLLEKHTRRSYIFSHDTYTPYPYQKFLYGLPKKVILDCIRGFALRNRSTTEPRTFHEWVLKHFGEGLGEHFFFPYNSKLFATNAKWTHPSWTGRFVPQVKIQDLIKGAYKKPKQEAVGYNGSFIYPKSGGIQSLISGIAEKIQKPIYYKK